MFTAVPFQGQLRCTDGQSWMSVGLAGAQVWVPPFSVAGLPVAPGPPLSGFFLARPTAGEQGPILTAPTHPQLWFFWSFLPIKTVFPPRRRPGYFPGDIQAQGARMEGAVSPGPGRKRVHLGIPLCPPGWVLRVLLGPPGLTSACSCRLWASCRTCSSSCVDLKSSSLSSLPSSSFRDKA